MPAWLKSKALRLNVIAIVVMVIQYLINNQVYPAYLGLEGLAVIVLDAIANILQSQTVKTLKAKLPK